MLQDTEDEEEIEEREAAVRECQFELENVQHELSEALRKKKFTLEELCHDGFDVTSTNPNKSVEGPDVSALAEAAASVGPTPPPTDLPYEQYVKQHKSAIETFAHMNSIGSKTYDKTRDYVRDH